MGMLGSMISASWWIVIRSYRQLNSGKFKVLDELENEMAFPLFRREWKILKTRQRRHHYWKITNVETFLPVVFGSLSAGFFIIGLLRLFKVKKSRFSKYLTENALSTFLIDMIAKKVLCIAKAASIRSKKILTEQLAILLLRGSSQNKFRDRP